MTFYARQVVSDCRIALQMLNEETDLARWRIHWAAAVALIRAVGHVLDKVDGRDKSVKAAAAELYKEWKGTAEEHQIFREFIEKERNNLLKEYQFNIHPLDDVPVVVEALLQPVGGGEPLRMAEVFDMEENLFRPMLDGPWEGEDAHDILGEAIEWWEGQLFLIDRKAAGEEIDYPQHD